MVHNGICCSDYLKSEDFTKGGTLYSYNRKIRRLTHIPTPKNEDCLLGGEATYYDYLFRLPWDATYRILGEDIIGGHDCFVVEGKCKIHPQHYISKRILWVDKSLFIDLHEEQYNRQGEIFRIFDKDWEQIKPSNWWVYKQWNILNSITQKRTIIQFCDWLIDRKYEDKEWDPSKMTEEHIWRKPDPSRLPPLITTSEDLPPEPAIRQEFWDKIGL